jgi:hypothetical protein
VTLPSATENSGVLAGLGTVLIVIGAVAVPLSCLVGALGGEAIAVAIFASCVSLIVAGAMLVRAEAVRSDTGRGLGAATALVVLLLVVVSLPGAIFVFWFLSR